MGGMCFWSKALRIGMFLKEESGVMYCTPLAYRCLFARYLALTCGPDQS